MASITVPQSDAVLVFQEELAHAGMSRVFLWLVRQGDRQRPVRVRLDAMGQWVLVPTPGSDQETIRAGAQLAMPTIRQALADAHFFESHDELDVAINTFHPQMTEAGQLPWDPASTPYVVE